MWLARCCVCVCVCVCVRRRTQSRYEAAVRLAGELQPYFEAATYYRKATRMKIWRVPVANLEHPERFEDRARELWQVDVPPPYWHSFHSFPPQTLQH